MSDARVAGPTVSWVNLHSALDMEQLRNACGLLVEELAGPVPWKVELSAPSGHAGLGEFAGVGSVTDPDLTVVAPHSEGWTRFDLRFQDDIIGSLAIAVGDIRDLESWNALARHLGAALVKLQLWIQAEEESCQRRLAQEVLGDISTVLGSFDIEYLLARSLEQVLRVVGSDVGSVMLWDGHRFSSSVVLGLPEEITRAVRLEGKTAAESVAETAAPVIIREPDLEEVPENLRTVHLDALLVIPLRSGGRVVGVLQAANPMFADPSSPSVVAAEGICRLAAVAVDNALLHREAVQRERMATIGQVMAGLSHDIKNMLHSIKAGFYCLRTGVEAGSLEQVGESIPLIEGAMERISGLVLDMLNYSKSRKPTRRPVDLNALAEEIAATLAPVAAEKDVRVRISADPKMEPVPADSTGVFRCVSNLLTNAIEAVERGGAVEITTRWPEGDAWAEILVRDDGPGIPEEDRDRVFDALFTTKGSKGTGLGLAVTRKIVEEHGGEIRLDSAPGQGTTFTIRLPKRPE